MTDNGLAEARLLFWQHTKACVAVCAAGHGTKVHSVSGARVRQHQFNAVFKANL
ncbi:hypothetical protein SAMN05519103_08551 [Rhizobiales bacterium GAS113]|nr:hypothetical protein SAMN05519103_08551 [Rhizobiales bacterium GAS113]